MRQLTIKEITDSLPRLNGLQHLGQMAGYHLRVDENDGTYWQRPENARTLPLCGGTFATAEQAWFDCVFVNYRKSLLAAMFEVALAGKLVHPQTLLAYNQWKQAALPPEAPE